MVDAERLRGLLQWLEQELVVLEDMAQERLVVRNDPRQLRGAKYSFITSIEACIDIAQHVCSSEGWRAPSTNADAMAVLHEHGVLDQRLAATMADAVRFRNLLVHRYAAVDDDLVVEHLDDVHELRRYHAVAAQLAR